MKSLKWEQAVDLLDVIKEFDRAGGVVQWRNREGACDRWEDIRSEYISLDSEEYRIKPKPPEIYLSADPLGTPCNIYWSGLGRLTPHETYTFVLKEDL